MEFPIKILNQLRPILRGFRKAQKLTQADIAKRLGITQQSYAQLEANPAAASLERLFKVLAILQVDVVLREREMAEKLVTTPMIDTVKNQSIPSEIKVTVQIPAERYDTNTGCISPTNAISIGQLGSDHSQVYPNTMNFAAQQLAMDSMRNIPSTNTLSDMAGVAAMNRASSDISKVCSATADITAMKRVDLEQLRGYSTAGSFKTALEQLQGHSAADSFKRDFLEQSKAFTEMTGLTAINRADLDIAKACSASADITAMNRIALEQLGGYSAMDSCKTALEQLQGYSATDSLKTDLEQLRGYSTADSFKTALEQLHGYSAADSLKTDLEQLRGYSTADSLKTALEQSKAFSDMTNELSLAFSSVKKKR